MIGALRTGAAGVLDRHLRKVFPSTTIEAEVDRSRARSLWAACLVDGNPTSLAL